MSGINQAVDAALNTKVFGDEINKKEKEYGEAKELDKKLAELLKEKKEEDKN